MIRHVVMWKMNGADADERAAQAAEVARRLNALSGVIPELRAVSAGAEAAYPGVNWDAVLVAEFDSVDDLEAYQVHPAHEEVVAYVRSVAADRAAVDMRF